jgi:hypothetical protein
MGFSFDDENHTDMAPIGRLLDARASDLQKFTLASCPENVTDYVIARMAKNSFPSLEEVELHAYSSIWRARFDALVAAPRLHTVRFQTWRIPSAHYDLTLLHLPWSQLRSFSISSSVSGHECLGILSYCPELTNLEVWVTSNMKFPSSAVILLKLSRLRLVSTIDDWGPSRTDIGRFLDVLRLPALHDLELCFIGRDPWNPLVSRFWEHHSAQLRAFSLSNLYFRADLHLFFRTMPDLTSLTLSPREIRLAAPDFDALRVERLLPALTHLDVAVGYAPGIVALESIRSAITLVEARAAESAENGVARLQRVKLADWTAWDAVERDLPRVDLVTMDMELNRLRELKAHGMHVQWQGPQGQRYDMLVPPDECWFPQIPPDDDEPRYSSMATSSRPNSDAGIGELKVKRRRTLFTLLRFFGGSCRLRGNRQSSARSRM